MEDEEKKEQNSAYAEVRQAIKDRTDWETRQRVWYEMRSHGLRRKGKPFPGAADLHFPLVDTNISKLKPFYFQQIVGTELVANFQSVGGGEDGKDYANEAAQWFHYQLTEESNHEEESLIADDHMLMSGRSVEKIFWDSRRKQVRFEAIDPVYIIVPKNTKELQEADWICHVQHLSKRQYKRRKQFNQDPEFLRSITGKGTDDPDGGALEEAQDAREGLHYGDKDQIVIHEFFEKQEDGKVLVKTYSPLRPDQQVRPDFRLPYIDDVTEGKVQTEYPFVDKPFEITDGGWYSPRGVPELVGVFEASACKMWNEKHDAMTYYNKPLYKNKGNRPFNAGNVTLKHGEVIDADIEAVQHGRPPISYDEELNNVRAVAEARLTMPDGGIGRSQNHSEPKTATEVARLAELMNTLIDMRAHVHRTRLARKYKLAWNRLKQYRAKDLAYHFREKLHHLPPAALLAKYKIGPSGSADSWNKAMQQQRAMLLFNTLKGSPFVDQGGLTKTLLEALDPGFVRQLYIDPELKAASEQEEQALQMLLLLSGYPAQPKEHEDHAARIPVILGKLEHLGATGQPVNPQAHQLIMQHLGQRMAMLKQKDPQAHGEMKQALKQMMQPEAETQDPAGPIPFPGGAR